MEISSSWDLRQECRIPSDTTERGFQSVKQEERMGCAAPSGSWDVATQLIIRDPGPWLGTSLQRGPVRGLNEARSSLTGRSAEHSEPKSLGHGDGVGPVEQAEYIQETEWTDALPRQPVLTMASRSLTPAVLEERWTAQASRPQIASCHLLFKMGLVLLCRPALDSCLSILRELRWLCASKPGFCFVSVFVLF